MLTHEQIASLPENYKAYITEALKSLPASKQEELTDLPQLGYELMVKIITAWPNKIKNETVGIENIEGYINAGGKDITILTREGAGPNVVSFLNSMY